MNVQKILTDAIALTIKDYGPKIYTEEVEQGFNEPCFFISLINATKSYMRTYWWKHIYNFDVHYFESSKAKAYEMAEKLIYQLGVITIGDNKFRGYNMSYDYVDNVLHLLISYQVSVREVNDEDKMAVIEITGGVKS